MTMFNTYHKYTPNQKPTYTTTNKPTNTSTNKPAYNHTNQPIYIPTVIQSSVKMAETLLLDGAMPLLPPGRRQWTSVSEEPLSITPFLKWPPKNWKSFNQDQKAFAAEYAANLLEQATGFHPMERILLLLKYNFLVLPGTILKTSSLKTIMLMLNYEVVRRIAINQDPDPESSKLQLIHSFPSTTTTRPSILDELNHIPLRLNTESTNKPNAPAKHSK
ncbi:hypothetical protein DPMN_076478 [Dreissena polymorpha]|uniref:Uncharacterized protein n=1 Tax=Dreissena polymorpha TaxID=45954 RepID=A0A9D3YIT3_DREPO|nr:hypothetical protein DPMN_076478 [Dreissena polymorpha]